MSLPFQPSLFGAGNPAADKMYSTLRRCQLDDESWVDVAPAWLSGADTLFEELAGSAAWDQRERWIHGRHVIEPRLTCGWTVGTSPPPLDDLATLLSQRYGVAFDSIWANYYRDGRDSVAWHGDRVRFSLQRPLVAIVSLGSRRRFGLRPRGGGAGRWFTLDGGDLLVMGGRSQHDWEHTVPKAAHGGPRISITYRHSRESVARPAPGTTD
ncbi:MAG TPA: alpha-ketoglutarate-dependent dioxygenase AlkB [Pseudonocardiaceae bacterium]